MSEFVVIQWKLWYSVLHTFQTTAFKYPELFQVLGLPPVTFLVKSIHKIIEL